MEKNLKLFGTFLAFGALGGCFHRSGLEQSAADWNADMNTAARNYVERVLALGEHDESYVDAYYGPPAWREQVKAARQPLAAIRADTENLIAQLRQLDPAGREELERLRHQYLLRQLQAVSAHAERLAGQKFSFNEEAQRLYDVTVPAYSASDFAPALARIEKLLPPGEGSLSDRYNRYLESFAIPPAKIQAVMQRAIAEARARTQQHIALPAGESFELRLVNNKAWSAYNWYQGNYRSLIEINTDLPLTATRVIDLAVHEGYPGHHVYHALLEQKLVRGRGWPEYQVYPLYSPQSPISEGTADLGIEIAFPDQARVAFLREVIFPAAGLDPAQARAYFEVTQAALELGGATIEAARRYRDGAASAQQAMDFMRRYALASAGRAKQRIAFFDSLGAYIVNYSLGRERVRAYLERRAQTPDQRWAVFTELISSPRLPSGLDDPQSARGE